jgi:acetyl-CoA acetyltransferase
MTRIGERDCVISGLGQSQVGRRLGRDGLDLTMDACLAAIADAGLAPGDIDGVSAWPGGMPGREPFAGPPLMDVQDALGLSLNWRLGGPEGPAQLAAIVNACMAISGGLARHVLCYRTVTEATGQGSGGRQGLHKIAARQGTSARLGDFFTYGALSPAHLIALYAARHFYEFGTTREQLASVAVNQRRNAGKNRNAVYRDPITVEDYLDAPMIASPLCLLDCDVPVDGSTAIIVSHADYAKDAPRLAPSVHAVGTALRGRPSYDQWDDMTTWAARDAAAHMWSRADLSPRDIDLAQLYDGFSFSVLVWLEALGLCGKGESGEFVATPDVINLEGRLPVNTGGGQLSAGRLHGFGHLHEAVLQMRGDAGSRQVKRRDVAVVTMGAGPAAGCVLLTGGRA